MTGVVLHSQSRASPVTVFVWPASESSRERAKGALSRPLALRCARQDGRPGQKLRRVAAVAWLMLLATNNLSTMTGKRERECDALGVWKESMKMETQNKVFFVICFRATALGVVFAPIQQIGKRAQGEDLRRETSWCRWKQL
jgi:hypothetical protein